MDESISLSDEDDIFAVDEEEDILEVPASPEGEVLEVKEPPVVLDLEEGEIEDEDDVREVGRRDSPDLVDITPKSGRILRYFYY